MDKKIHIKGGFPNTFGVAKQRTNPHFERRD